MAKKIDVSLAATWTEAETQANIRYLTQRVKWAQIDQINEAGAEMKPKKSTKAEKGDE